MGRRKRWETASTNLKNIGVNLTQTHGDRSGPDAFYKLGQFDRLILFDVGFNNLRIIDDDKIPRHLRYPTHLIGRFKWPRDDNNEKLEGFYLAFLKALKFKNKDFPEAIESLRKEYDFSYKNLLKKCCNLTLNEIDSLFSQENFRLITGAKGFSAEEHFNVFLEKMKIPYKQETDMYSKVDHWINGNIRVQVKIPYQKGVTKDKWAFKTHKSHGHGEGELYKKDMFDILALFVGFEIDESKDKYLPVSVKEQFIFIPVEDLEEHPNHPGYFKRVSRVLREKYKINDSSLLNNL